MDEYISKEAVVRYLKGYSEKELNHNGNYGMITSSVLNKVERALSEMPAADVQPVNDWISVKDRLPEKNTWVLCYVKFVIPIFEMERGICKYSDVKKVFFEGEFRIDIRLKPTHWMPLPEPPESEDE